MTDAELKQFIVTELRKHIAALYWEITGCIEGAEYTHRLKVHEWLKNNHEGYWNPCPKDEDG